MSACTRIISICYLITRICDRIGGGILIHPIWGYLKRTVFLGICAFLFLVGRNNSSNNSLHEAWHGFIGFGRLRHLSVTSETARWPIIFDEWETKLLQWQHVGLYLCLDFLPFFLKGTYPSKSLFRTKRIKRQQYVAFRINASVCKNSQGFPEWPPTEAATSGCHAVTTGEQSLGTG